MAYEPFKSAAWQGSIISFSKPEHPFRFMTVAETYAEGAQRYRAHAARQTLEGKFEHAACSLLKAEHKDRMAARSRLWFED